MPFSGGGPFDADPRSRASPPVCTPTRTERPSTGRRSEQRTRLLLEHDQIKVGLAGNLRDYEFVDRTGATVTGADVDYNGQPAGYAGDPSETITYVDAHDNETLFDVLQYKLPQATSMDDRVRMNTVALATTALAQGPSFWHAGSDLLRSKSLDRNSFDSGDWFNRIDWSATESTWGSGLPPRADNESKWVYMLPLLGDGDLEPAPDELADATAAAAELLRIRFSSPLFRLGTADRIQDRVAFPIGGPGQTPGVITMTLDDQGGRDLDRAVGGHRRRVQCHTRHPDPDRADPCRRGVHAAPGTGRRLGLDREVGDVQRGDRRLHRPAPNRRRLHHHLNPGTVCFRRRVAASGADSSDLAAAQAIVISGPPAARHLITSSSVVWLKSRYHSPTERYQRGELTHTNSSASPRRSLVHRSGATGTASTSRAAPRARTIRQAARADDPVAIPSSTITAVRPSTGDRRGVAPELTCPPRQFGALALLDRGDLIGRRAYGLHDALVEEPDATLADRTHRQLGLGRCAELADDDHVERRGECERDLERHRNPASWQAEHDDGTTPGIIVGTPGRTLGRKVPEQAGQPAAGVSTIRRSASSPPLARLQCRTSHDRSATE